MPLTDKENRSYEEQELCHICKKKFCKDEHDENYRGKKKVKDHCHYTGEFRGTAHSDCNLKYRVSNNIPIVIHNASYDSHFIINQLAEEFKGELNCIGENMEKYITFSDDDKTITHKLNFIDSFSFMTASLSDLVDSTSKIFISKLCIKCMEKNKINAECKFNWLKVDELE